VHAFATDPARGLFILIFLFIVIGGSLALYAWRYNLLQKNNPISLFSRETGLLVNNILLVTAMLSVLLGTLYPLILDTLNLGKISVGVPYFNAVFIPIMLPAFLVMAIVPFVRWKKDNLMRIASHLRLYWLGILALILVARIILTDNVYVLSLI
jgi:cytochrome c-type biogenesis protein CcmF